MPVIFEIITFIIVGIVSLLCLIGIVINVRQGKKDMRIYLQKKKEIDNHFLLQEAEAIVNNYLLRRQVLRSIRDDHIHEDEEF